MTATLLNGADRVVEQGTDGIWTWRKWASGVAECWGTYSASIAVNFASGSYGGYRSLEQVVDFPFAFAAVPVTVLTMGANSQGVWADNAQSTTATQCRLFLSSGISMAAATRSVNIHAVGRWK